MTEPRFVEVAVDAPGVPGGRCFTYRVPASLADIEPGEAVMVEFGRRRAVGVILDEGTEPPVAAKPLLARVRADRALLGPLARRLAGHVSQHYLAPPGLVVRAMLPPGTLERIELYAVVADAGEGTAGLDPLLATVAAAGESGVAVDELPEGSSRAMRLRALRALEMDGAVRLEWRVVPASVRPRQRRWAAITDDGRAAAAILAAGERPAGPPLGPRQRALLAELAEPGHGGAEVAARLGRAAWLVRGRRAGQARLAAAGGSHRGSSSAGGSGGADSRQPTRGQRARRRAGGCGRDRARRRSSRRRHETVLLDGDTASGKTAVYAAAIASALAAGRGALVLVPEIALATPLIDRLAA